MDCKESRSLLPLSVDGELDVPTETALAEHLATCATCTAIRQARDEALTALRRAASYHRAPEELRARIAAALPASAPSAREAPARDRAPSRWRTLWWPLLNGGGLAAAICAAIVLAVVLPAQPAAEAQLADALVASHARALLTDHVIDIASSDRHTVKPWFNGKLDFSPVVADYAERGFALAGGRLDYVDHHPVAVLVYRYQRHFIDVFVWPADGVAASTAPAHSAQGYQVAGKTRSGMNFRAVSDVDGTVLAQLVDLL